MGKRGDYVSLVTGTVGTPSPKKFCFCVSVFTILKNTAKTVYTTFTCLTNSRYFELSRTIFLRSHLTKRSNTIDTNQAIATNRIRTARFITGVRIFTAAV